MENKIVAAPQELFRMGLIRGTVVCCVMAAICAMPGVGLLFSPEYASFLINKIITGGITARSAVTTWQIINTVITVASFVCPVVTAAGLILVLRGKPAKGFGFLSNGMSFMMKAARVCRIVLIILFAYRAARYVAGNIGSPQAVMNIYSMVISEGLMGVLAWFVFRCLIGFMEGGGDAAASMAYTFSSGRIDNLSIPAAAERGFLVLGILCPVWAVSQLVTVTIVVNHIQSYYSLVFASHPAEYLAAASLVCNGVAGILMCLYLKRYNRICEWEKYQARKRT